MPELPRQSYTERATDVIIEAVNSEHDFGGWLAEVLARAAAELGSTHVLTARRPGSWEADLVHQLVARTVGWNDEHLETYRRLPSFDPYQRLPSFDEAVRMPRDLVELRSFINWLDEPLDADALTEDNLVARINQWRVTNV